MRIATSMLAILLLVGYFQHGQAAQVDWVSPSDLNEVSISKIRPTQDGGFILAGKSYSGGPDSNGSQWNRALVVRLENNGTVLWSKSFGVSEEALDVMEMNWGFLVAYSTGGDMLNKLLRLNDDGDSIGISHGSTILEPAVNGGAWTLLQADRYNLSGDSIPSGFSLLRLDSEGYVLQRFDYTNGSFTAAAMRNDLRLATLFNNSGGKLYFWESDGSSFSTAAVFSNGGTFYGSSLAVTTDGGIWAGASDCPRSYCRYQVSELDSAGESKLRDFRIGISDSTQILYLKAGRNNSLFMLGGGWHGTRSQGGEFSGGYLADSVSVTTYPCIAVYGKGNNYDSAPKIIFPQFGSTSIKTSKVLVDHPPPLEYYFKDALPLGGGKVILVGKLRDEQGKSILAIKVTLPEDPVGLRQGTATLVRKRENRFFNWNLLGRRFVQKK